MKRNFIKSHRPRLPTQSWGQRSRTCPANQGTRYACRFRNLSNGEVEAEVVIPGQEASDATVFSGVSMSPGEAIFRALGGSLLWTDEQSEILACRAALRGRVLRVERHRNELQALDAV